MWRGETFNKSKKTVFLSNKFANTPSETLIQRLQTPFVQFFIKTRFLTFLRISC